MNILLTGGGTLGSVTPLLAVVDELTHQYRSFKFVWLGTTEGPERLLVEQAGIQFKAIPSGKWRRYFSWQNIIDLFRILAGFILSLYWLKRLKVQGVVAAGGFVSVPVGWAAWLWRIPLVIHQQDIEHSLSNRLLSWCANKITVASEESVKDFPKNKVSFIGNPIRSIYQQQFKQDQVLSDLGLNPKRATILVVGGGTGADFINKLVAESWPSLLAFCQIILITGKNKNVKVEPSAGLVVKDLVTTELPALMQAVDLIVSRAGMGFISELAYLSKPSVIVPIPKSHQEQNAAYLSKHQAALVMAQSDLNPDYLVNQLKDLLEDQERQLKLADNLHKLFPSGASKALANIIIQEIKKV
ncbi:MAG: UDP-N-acetylglucosamine--N-acetylmuramyl-(pentapeptide) pyrophosphoryl-undecaprenol N-acetylglucosamine transferase [Patescibacteria group bacterium]